MVIHESIAVSPSTNIYQSNLASKKYVVVKNHVREITNGPNNKAKLEESDNHEQVVGENVNNSKIRKRKSNNYTVHNEGNSVTCEISKTDLQELRQVYVQCKSVLETIERKYGHILNLSNDNQDNLLDSEDLEGEVECNCSRNKKIIFDDNGKQIFKDSQFEKHICLKKLKHNHSHDSPINTSNLKIEDASDDSIELPDSLKDLGNMLKQPDINNQLRRNVIKKIKSLRQDYINELKFDKQALVEKLKANSEELLGFEGTNLSTIVGYPA